MRTPRDEADPGPTCQASSSAYLRSGSPQSRRITAEGPPGNGQEVTIGRSNAPTQSYMSTTINSRTLALAVAQARIPPSDTMGRYSEFMLLPTATVPVPCRVVASLTEPKMGDPVMRFFTSRIRCPDLPFAYLRQGPPEEMRARRWGGWSSRGQKISFESLDHFLFQHTKYPFCRSHFA